MAQTEPQDWEGKKKLYADEAKRVANEIIAELPDHADRAVKTAVRGIVTHMMIISMFNVEQRERLEGRVSAIETLMKPRHRVPALTRAV